VSLCINIRYFCLCQNNLDSVIMIVIYRKLVEPSAQVLNSATQ
jgi:hypothetical protein